MPVEACKWPVLRAFVLQEQWTLLDSKLFQVPLGTEVKVERMNLRFSKSEKWQRLAYLRVVEGLFSRYLGKESWFFGGSRYVLKSPCERICGGHNVLTSVNMARARGQRILGTVV